MDIYVSYACQISGFGHIMYQTFPAKVLDSKDTLISPIPLLVYIWTMHIKNNWVYSFNSRSKRYHLYQSIKVSKVTACILSITAYILPEYFQSNINSNSSLVSMSSWLSPHIGGAWGGIQLTCPRNLIKIPRKLEKKVRHPHWSFLWILSTKSTFPGK